MRSITQQFTVHPVGQGLFYSGTIEIKSNNQEELFRFVFDCGSLTLPAGTAEVDRYKKEQFSNDSDRLDLLVISHFDADHVNQIKYLLAPSRKVKKIIMPFVDFEERLFLVLRYLERKNTSPDDNDLESVRFILDPESELAPHIDDDDNDNTAIYLVTTDPDNPTGNGETNESNSNGFVPENPSLEFWFNGQERRLNVDERKDFLLHFTSINESKVGIVKDSIAGNVHFANARWLQLMEFIFYRREASGNEKAFYKEVFAAFCRRYKIDTDDRSVNAIDAIINALRTIKGATEVRKCYDEAKRKIPNIKITGRDILNMNTTALCMLHRNLSSVIRIFRNNHNWAHNP